MRTTFEHLPLLHKGMLHAVGLTSELDEPAVVHDAVDDGRSHLVVPEHPSPAGELQVGRDDHALALVGVGEDLEDEARPVAIERLDREIRRRTRVVGTFPDGRSALMLATARLKYVAGSEWGARRYLDVTLLDE